MKSYWELITGVAGGRVSVSQPREGKFDVPPKNFYHREKDAMLRIDYKQTERAALRQKKEWEKINARNN